MPLTADDAKRVVASFDLSGFDLSNPTVNSDFFSVPEGLERVEPVPSVDKGGGAFGDVLAAPFRGIEAAAQDVYGLVDTLTGDLLPDYETRFLGESETVMGGIVESATNFLVGFVPVFGWLGGASKVAKAGKLAAAGENVGNLLRVGKKAEAALKARYGAKIGNVLARSSRGMVAGATIDFAFFAGAEERLSNFIEQVPGLSNPVTAFLAADEDDSELLGRMKNVLEGAGLGVLTDGVIEAIKGMRKGLGVLRKGGSPAEAGRVLQESASGPVRGSLQSKWLGADLAEVSPGARSELPERAARAEANTVWCAEF